MFSALVFTVAKKYKETSCLSTGEWINKMWYSYTVEYYSSHVNKWTDIYYNKDESVNVMLKEASDKRSYFIWLYLFEIFKIETFIDTESRSLIPRAWNGGIGNNCKWIWGFFWYSKNILELDRADGCSTLCLF